MVASCGSATDLCNPRKVATVQNCCARTYKERTLITRLLQKYFVSIDNKSHFWRSLLTFAIYYIYFHLTAKDKVKVV